MGFIHALGNSSGPVELDFGLGKYNLIEPALRRLPPIASPAWCSHLQEGFMDQSSDTQEKTEWSARRWILVALAGVSGTLLAGLLAVTLVLDSLDINDFANEIAAELSSELGRKVEIKGRLHGKLFSLSPQFVAHDIRIANTQWGSEPHMLRIAKLDALFDIQALLRGKFLISDIRLSGVTLLLETDAQERGNWVFRKSADRSGTDADDAIVFRNVVAVGVKILFKNPAQPKPDVIDIARFRMATSRLSGATDVWIIGEALGHKFNFESRMGSVDRLLAGDATPLSFTLHHDGKDDLSGHANVRLGDRLSFEGSVTFENIDLSELDTTTSGTAIGYVSLVAFQQIAPHADARLSLKGDKLIVGEETLRDLEGELQLSDQRLVVKKFSVKTGESDLAGVLNVNLRGPIRGEVEIRSRRLNVADVDGIAPIRRKRASNSTKRILGSKDYQLKVSAKIGLLKYLNDEFRQASAVIYVSNQGLRVHPFQFRFAGGRAQGSATINNASAVKFNAQLSLGGPALRLQGDLSTIEGYMAGRPAKLNVVARMAKSDVTARLTVSAGKRPVLAGTIYSKNLVVGSPDVSRGQSLKQSVNDPLPLELFDRVRGTVRFRVDRLAVRSATLSRLQGTVRFTGNGMVLKPIEMSMIGGRLSGWSRLDLSKPKPQLSLDLRLLRAKVGEMSPELKGESRIADVNVGARLTANGRTLAELISGMTGNVTLILGSLQAKDDANALEELGTGVLASLVHFGSLKGGKVQCVVVSMDFQQGLGRSRLMLIDTEAMSFYGKGTIDLRKWHANIVMLPQNKTMITRHFRLAAVRFSGPIDDAKPSLAVGEAAEANIKGVFKALADPLVMMAWTLGIKPGLEFRNKPCPIAVEQAVKHYLSPEANR